MIFVRTSSISLTVGGLATQKSIGSFCSEFVGEVSLFMIATLFCEMCGAKNLERMFQEVQFNSENELDHSPECSTKNKYH